MTHVCNSSNQEADSWGKSALAPQQVQGQPVLWVKEGEEGEKGGRRKRGKEIFFQDLIFQKGI